MQQVYPNAFHSWYQPQSNQIGLYPDRSLKRRQQSIIYIPFSWCIVTNTIYWYSLKRYSFSSWSPGFVFHQSFGSLILIGWYSRFTLLLKLFNNGQLNEALLFIGQMIRWRHRLETWISSLSVFGVNSWPPWKLMVVISNSKI